jgi:hypothetical protein
MLELWRWQFDVSVIQLNQELRATQNEATEAAVEAIIEEVKEVIKKEEVVIYPQPNHFSGCNCFKCVRWKNQNAK